MTLFELFGGDFWDGELSWLREFEWGIAEPSHFLLVKKLKELLRPMLLEYKM